MSIQRHDIVSTGTDLVDVNPDFNLHQVDVSGSDYATLYYLPPPPVSDERTLSDYPAGEWISAENNVIDLSDGAGGLKLYAWARGIMIVTTPGNRIKVTSGDK